MRRLILALVFFTSSAFGWDVTGKWKFSVETDAGNGSPTFILKQDGERITGSYSGALGEAAVTGKVDGVHVSLSFSVEGNDVVYSGTVQTDTKKMKGSVKLGALGSGTFTAEKE